MYVLMSALGPVNCQYSFIIFCTFHITAAKEIKEEKASSLRIVFLIWAQLVQEEWALLETFMQDTTQFFD